ncbi:hypothetical protein SAVIM40S_05397 [Streptomyces avidinii]
MALALLLGGGGFAAWKFEWFSGNGEAVSFGKNAPPPAADKADPSAPATAAKPSGDPDVLMPTGPKSDFKQTAELEDGTIIAKTRLTGAKSGFEGNVWVWAPKEYDDPKYAKSAFPVLISLPGGNGFPDNYWADRSLGLQKAITDGAKAGTSLPFVVSCRSSIRTPSTTTTAPTSPARRRWARGSPRTFRTSPRPTSVRTSPVTAGPSWAPPPAPSSA